MGPGSLVVAHAAAVGVRQATMPRAGEPSRSCMTVNDSTVTGPSWSAT